MHDKLMTRTGILTAVFAAAAIFIILGFASGRECVYVTAKEDETQLKKEQIDFIRNTSFTDEKKELFIIEEKNEAGHFMIPLPATVTEEDILIENSYAGHKMYITLSGIEKEFYEKHPLTMSEKFVSTAYYQQNKNIVRIELQLNKLYEHNALVKNSSLYFNFSNPAEVYDKIVVLDAGYSEKKDNADITKEITAMVCQKLTKKLESNGIKVYSISKEGSAATMEEKISLPNQLKADMFIGFSTVDSMDSEMFGIRAIYNADYFIPTLGSIQLSDIMEKNIVTECKTKALGLEAAKAEYAFLQQITVPATVIELGYLSNEIEKDALSKEPYIEKIVEGALKGVLEAYRLAE